MGGWAFYIFVLGNFEVNHVSAITAKIGIELSKLGWWALREPPGDNKESNEKRGVLSKLGSARLNRVKWL